jgi:hypothetical protein
MLCNSCYQYMLYDLKLEKAVLCNPKNIRREIFFIKDLGGCFTLICKTNLLKISQKDLGDYILWSMDYIIDTWGIKQLNKAQVQSSNILTQLTFLLVLSTYATKITCYFTIIDNFSFFLNVIKCYHGITHIIQCMHVLHCMRYWIRFHLRLHYSVYQKKGNPTLSLSVNYWVYKCNFCLDIKIRFSAFQWHVFCAILSKTEQIWEW